MKRLRIRNDDADCESRAYHWHPSEKIWGNNLEYRVKVILLFTYFKNDFIISKIPEEVKLFNE